MPSIRKNLVYSILLVLANYLFPFLTYPYVSRVLGVDNIGAVNFVDSVINYFILFSMLGVETFGVRELAKHRGHRDSLNKVFSSLFFINLGLTLIMLIVLVLVTFTVPTLAEHKELMFFGAFKLVFNCFLMEWLFKGLEDFRLISIRSIIVKTLYVVSVFVFIKRSDDVWKYYMLSCLMVVANALVNMVASRNRVRLTFKDLQIGETFKSVLGLGLYTILTSMYTTLNITYLGFVAGDTQVGYYTTATKLYGIIMALFTAFTGVMIPRMSNVVAEGDFDKFKSYYGLAVDLLFSFSFPLIVWMMLMAPDIVSVISGPGYEGSIVPMVIISPLLFIIGYEQILALQTLLPLGRDSVLLRNSIVGAVMGVVLNVLLVPGLLAIGSACVWAACELVILLLCQTAVTKEIRISFPYVTTAKNIIGYLPLALLMFVCSKLEVGLFVRLGLSMMVVAVYVFFFQLIINKRNIIKLVLRV